MGRRVGVMGGTFDPIHNGHLVAAEEARWQFQLEEVVFVPAGHPWMKAHKELSSREDRYLMATLGTAGNASFSVSPIEIQKNGPTHTVDTLRQMREETPEELDLYFITGADAILELFQWKQPEEALRLAHFIAATRPGYDMSGFANDLAERHLPISVMDVPALAISSTDIRHRVREGRPVRYLLPDTVIAYIEKAGLYR